MRNEFIQPVLTGAQVDQYRQLGYLALGKLLADDALAAVREECMKAWAAEKAAFDPSGTWLNNSLLPNVHHVCPTVRRYYFHGPLVDVAERLIGPNIKGATSQLTFKMRGNTMPFAWHQDNGYGQLDPYNALTTLTALDDTDRENGCLWLIPRSHRGQIALGDEFNSDAKRRGAEISLAVDPSKAIPMEMKAGECLIFHCWMLHKSDGNRSPDRDRRILFLRYADADAVEVYNDRRPRLGRLLRGRTRFEEVERFEAELDDERNSPNDQQ